ncbi:MAG TPA: hypothetical protein VF269_04390 [Rhodanobacteraceae bacterium]
MHRTIRWTALGAAMFALAACSHHQSQNPILSYVPANSPYVLANLKPLTKDIRARLGAPGAMRMSLSADAMQLDHAAVDLDKHGKPHLANVMRTLATTIGGKSMSQVAQELGIDINGMFAAYGLGLSPVARGQLTDPAKFHAYISKLETAYGKTMGEATFDKVNYQTLTLGKSGLQFIVATHARAFTLAILPVKASDQQLGEALGVTKPQHSLVDAQRLSKLAKSEGYLPYLIGYFDTTKLPPLIAGMRDPMLQTLITAAGGQSTAAKNFPASCQPDLVRIAARMPMISMGYTHIASDSITTQMDMALAPDITKAFAGIGTHVPGLGSASQAPFDLALALPVTTLRDFGMAQADAVQAHPFTCPALTGLNKAFADLKKWLPKAGVPPFGSLRGFHIITDKIVPAAATSTGTPGMPDASARLLVASSNPAGLLNIIKAFLPGAAQLNITNNGKPVALTLPNTLATKVHHKPIWLAMGKQALAIGVGAGEDAKLGALVNAAGGAAGTLSSLHVNGAMYAQWLQSTISAYNGYLARARAKAGKPPLTTQQQKQQQASLDMAFKSLKAIKDISAVERFDKHGLRVTSTVRWNKP